MRCRACLHTSLDSIIPLGDMPLANALVNSKNEQESLYNLEVLLCANCGLAQLRDTIPPDALFSDYVYFSSNSDTMLHSAFQLVDQIIPTLNDDAFIIEIASNDGYLLKNYIKRNMRVLGIDPAQNIASQANHDGIPTLCDFFSEKLASQLIRDGIKADVIHANNVMAHVPDINDFIRGLKILLKPDGYCIIEIPYFLDLVEKLEFDTIYHEHVFYFSVKPLIKAFLSHGLEIFDIKKLSIHGGSLRLFVGHSAQKPIQSIVNDFVLNEEQRKLYSLSKYFDFMNDISTLRVGIVSLLQQLKESGSKLAAYGASAKGTTLLNFFKIDKNLIDFVVDRSIVKQGKYTPGTHLPIKAPEKLLTEKVNYALLLTWNFLEEIIKQQASYISTHGKFIVPFPEVRIVP